MSRPGTRAAWWSFVSFLCLLAPLWPAPARANEPRCVIVLIGDGMGFEQLRAGGMYAHGAAGTLFLESLPYAGELTTHSASSNVTDSAAAATAIATGVKVSNGVISMAYPGDGSELPTLLEAYRDTGRATGLVTTTYMTHATPAAFGAHEPSRDRLAQIGTDYLQQTRPDILLGGGGNGLSPAAAEDSGYMVVQDRAGLLALDRTRLIRVSGQFGGTHLPYELDGLGDLPHLGDMTAVALDMLNNDPDGFLLMVEGGRIDHACHNNDIQRAVHEVLEFDRTVRMVIDWASGRDDVLVVVTADHETGGLEVLGSRGAGAYPDVSWSTGGHTGVRVPLYAWGRNAHRIGGVVDNTELLAIITAPGVDAASGPAPADGTSDVPGDAVLTWTAGTGAVSHDIHFGTVDPPPFVASSVSSSFLPGPLDAGTTYYWRIDEVGEFEIAEGPVWSFVTTSVHGPTEVGPSAETLVTGTLTSDFRATWSPDGQSERLTEVLVGGRKPGNQRSVLEHEWIFEVPAGDLVTFHILARASANEEGDDFSFAYSVDGTGHDTMFSITGTDSGDGYRTYSLPPRTAGALRVRVTDTDASRGNTKLDSLAVDHLFFRSEPVLDVPGIASASWPADGAGDVDVSTPLRWTVGDRARWHDVFLGTTPGGLQLVAQDLLTNSLDPGPLAENTTYYWRVEEINSAGPTAGPVWSFTTGSGSCAPLGAYVGSVDLETVKGSAGARSGMATVGLVDDCGQPVEGALVTGHFTGDFAAEPAGSEVTDANGVAVFMTATQTRKPSFSFVVDDVSHPTLAWSR